MTSFLQKGFKTLKFNVKTRCQYLQLLFLVTVVKTKLAVMSGSENLNFNTRREHP